MILGGDGREGGRRRPRRPRRDRSLPPSPLSLSLSLSLLVMAALASAGCGARRAAASSSGFGRFGVGRPTCFASRAGVSSCSSRASSSAVATSSSSSFSRPERFRSRLPPAMPSSTALYAVGRGRGSSSSTAAAMASTAEVVPSQPAGSGRGRGGERDDRASNEPTPRTKKKKKGADTGRLRLLPPLQPPAEILSSAARRTFREVKDDPNVANARRRVQKRGAQSIDALSQKLCRPLKEAVRTYRRELQNVHPFEGVVLDLTVRSRRKKDGLSLSALLEDVHEGRKELLQLSKDWIAKVKAAPTAREAHETAEEAKESLGKVFLDLIGEPWEGLTELQKGLRNAPVVRLDCPAVVLVGAPNVGKSSIVRAISSGTPEVNNYPFTTRGMTLGHVQVFWESDRDVALGNVAGVSVPSDRELVREKLLRRGVKTRRMREEEASREYSREAGDAEAEGDAPEGSTGGADVDEGGRDGSISQRADAVQATASKKVFPVSQLCQIMDSPGILRRDDAEARNEMEELTLAAMAHLPTAVMYVMDLSGGAGDKCSSVEDQLVLRRDVRARFPRRPWIDVISKVDLGIVDGARERLVQILDAEREQRGGGDEEGGHHFIELSIKEGQGVDELRQEVMRMLGEVRVVLDAMAAMDERSARAV